MHPHEFIDFDSTMSIRAQRKVHIQIGLIIAFFVITVFCIIMNNPLELHDGVRGLIVIIATLMLFGAAGLFLDILKYNGSKGRISNQVVEIDASPTYGIYKSKTNVGAYPLSQFTTIIRYSHPVGTSGINGGSREEYIALRDNRGSEILLISPDNIDQHHSLNMLGKLHLMTNLPAVKSQGKIIRRERPIDQNQLPEDMKFVHSNDKNDYDRFGRLRKR